MRIGIISGVIGGIYNLIRPCTEIRFNQEYAFA